MGAEVRTLVHLISESSLLTLTLENFPSARHRGKRYANIDSLIFKGTAEVDVVVILLSKMKQRQLKAE